MTMTPRVLIADDDPDIREVLAFSFGLSGFEIHTAVDGRAALEGVVEHDPDLVVLDWMMPRLDGIEVCRRLRTDSDRRRVPVIFLSARTSEMDVMLGMLAGASDYVTKPFSPRALVHRAEQVLAASAPVRPSCPDHSINLGYAG